MSDAAIAPTIRSMDHGPTTHYMSRTGSASSRCWNTAVGKAIPPAVPTGEVGGNGSWRQYRLRFLDPTVAPQCPGNLMFSDVLNETNYSDAAYFGARKLSLPPTQLQVTTSSPLPPHYNAVSGSAGTVSGIFRISDFPTIPVP